MLAAPELLCPAVPSAQWGWGCLCVSEEPSAPSPVPYNGAALFSRVFLPRFLPRTSHGIPGPEHRLRRGSAFGSVRGRCRGARRAGRWPEGLSGDLKPLPIIQRLSSNTTWKRLAGAAGGGRAVRAVPVPGARTPAPAALCGLPIPRTRGARLAALPRTLMLPVASGKQRPGRERGRMAGDAAAALSVAQTQRRAGGAGSVPPASPVDRARSVVGIADPWEPPPQCHGQLL